MAKTFDATDIPRLVPEKPFPPYTFVPGFFPHPANDPEGHSYGIEAEECEEFDPNEWRSCQTYLYAIDLFNHGYYWEAHETWETLWNACGRHGIAADFLKGLIKLAAAGVKVRESVPDGVRKLAVGARSLFRKTTSILGTEEADYMGLSLNELIQHTRDMIHCLPIDHEPDSLPVKRVFDFILKPKARG